MAEIRVFASQAKRGGGKLHLGATSMDIEDTVETYRLPSRAFATSARISHELLAAFGDEDSRATPISSAWRSRICSRPSRRRWAIGSPSYAQDLLIDDANLRFVFENLTTKGLRGAVGTAASYERLCEQRGRSARDRSVRARAFRAAGARDQHANLSAQARLSVALRAGRAWARRFRSSRPTCAFLRSPGFGEVAEPFGASQVGSSAMPFKRNPDPLRAHRLARAAASGLCRRRVAERRDELLERTLDDSANRRTMLPEALLCADEIVTLARKVVDGLRVEERRIAQNLRTYAPFAGTEAVMMEAVRAGGDRQRLHEAICAVHRWRRGRRSRAARTIRFRACSPRSAS